MAFRTWSVNFLVSKLKSLSNLNILNVLDGNGFTDYGGRTVSALQLEPTQAHLIQSCR